jgi:hypothetical protein
MVSRLPLRKHRYVPGFLRDTLHIRRQLAQTEGLVGYSLNAKLLHKTFWTYSVWLDRGSLERFAAADPHATIIQRLRPRMGAARFEFFDASGAELPATWDQRMARIPGS